MTYAPFKSICGQMLPGGSPTTQRMRNKWDGMDAKCTECRKAFIVRRERLSNDVQPFTECPSCGKSVKVSLCLGYPE